MGQLNFDNIPKSNPFGHVDKGFYRGVVKGTEVKQDNKQQDFLAVVFNLFKPDGKPAGTFTDYVRVTEAAAPLYKLGRMLQAMDINNLTGNIDLRLLAKVITPGKEVAMEIDDNEYPKGTFKSQIKIFDSQCYWPVSMLPGLVAAQNTAPGAVAVPEPQTPAPWDGAVAPTPAPAPVAATAGNFEFNAADGVVPPATAPQAAPAPVTENATGVQGDNY